MRHALGGLLIAVAALVASPSTVFAQDPEPEPEPQLPTDTELVFEREVFQYAAFTRRNPFLALDGDGGGGPRYEQLSLIGIMYSEDPSASVAVMSTGGVEVAEDGTLSAIEGDAYYVKVGQNVGNITVVEVHRDRVVVEVEEFGLVDRRTMVFLSRR
jgi:hypothetical protein